VRDLRWNASSTRWQLHRQQFLLAKLAETPPDWRRDENLDFCGTHTDDKSEAAVKAFLQHPTSIQTFTHEDQPAGSRSQGALTPPPQWLANVLCR